MKWALVNLIIGYHNINSDKPLEAYIVYIGLQ